MITHARRKRASKKKKRSTTLATRQKFPVWYPNSERNQSIAEFLAFNAYLDRLIGIEPSPDRAPYNQFKRSTVEAFLARLRDATAKSTLASINVI